MPMSFAAGLYVHSTPQTRSLFFVEMPMRTRLACVMIKFYLLRHRALTSQWLRFFAAGIGVSFAAVSSVFAQEADWNQFRGPNGDGHAPSGIPLAWSTTDGIAWKVPIPGRGWSSPVVGTDRIYLTTAVADDEDQDALGVDRELRALCLDATSGEILWNQKVLHQDGASAPRIHKKNSHASPTPILTKDRLFVHFGHMGTACLDLDGEIQWSQSSLPYSPTHGNGSTPVLHEGLLIYGADAAKNPFIVALHAKSGDVAWRTPRSETRAKRKFSFASPSIFKPEGGGAAQLISPASGAVFSYDPKTGQELWKAGYDEGYSVIPKPVFFGNLAFIGTGYDRATAIAVRIDDESTGDVTESHREWQITKRMAHTPSMLVAGDLLYVVSDGGIASCIEPKTGDIIWQERAGGSMSASPIYSDGRIYLLDETGTCTVLKAGREFEILSENALDERSLASPAIVGTDLLIRTEEHLFRISGK